MVDRSEVYGQDSEIALQVMMTDLTAAQRKEILKNYRNGKISGRLSNSISDDGDGGASQFKSDVKSLVTGDHNLATAALGSYTAKYEVLRANGRGLQYRMTIKKLDDGILARAHCDRVWHTVRALHSAMDRQ